MWGKLMRILIFSWRGPKHPNAGGAEISTHEHAKGWVRAGHEVTLFTSFFENAKREEIIDGVKILRYGGQVGGVHLRALIWYLFSSHQKYDLIIDQFHGIPFFTPFFVRAKKLAFIHEVTKEVWRLNPWPVPFNFFPFFLGPFFEPLIFKLVYKNIPFMTVSASTKFNLMEWGTPKKNIVVINNGISTPGLDKISTKEKKKTLIYLGALSQDKGIEDAILTFSIINNEEGHWQFWVLGQGSPSYLKKLKLMYKNLGITGRIKFFGFVSDNEKFKLLSRAHILVNPSIREGWGLVNIEANRMGVPVIAYDVSGIRDSVRNGQTGYLLPLGDFRGLAKKIMEVMNDQNLYKRLQKNAISWSKNFSWEISVRKSLKLIERLVRKE